MKMRFNIVSLFFVGWMGVCFSSMAANENKEISASDTVSEYRRSLLKRLLDYLEESDKPDPTKKIDWGIVQIHCCLNQMYHCMETLLRKLLCL